MVWAYPERGVHTEVVRTWVRASLVKSNTCSFALAQLTKVMSLHEMARFLSTTIANQRVCKPNVVI